jgi:hypothetical protein
MRQASMRDKVVSVLVVGAIVCAVILPVGIPAAQAAAPGKAGVGADTRLEFQLQRLQLFLQGQGLRLDMSRTIATQTQTWIDALKADGKDTSALQSALDAFNGQVQAMQAAHDKAKGVLDAKAGFDAGGKVVDAGQARQTVQDARQAMKDAHGIIKSASDAFRDAVKAFRQANKPKVPPAPGASQS